MTMVLQRINNIFRLDDKRDLRIDSIKGPLILLVVIGHQIEPFIEVSPMIHAVFLLIYSFHMPLFVMISGYLTNPSADSRKFWRGELILFEALLMFQTIRCLLTTLYFGFSWRMLITPEWTLWYLLSLIFWRFFLFVAYRVNDTRKVLLVLLAASVLMALAFGFIPVGTEFSFQRTFYFFPFFVTGALLCDLHKHSPGFRPSRWVLVMATLLSVVCIVYLAYSIASRPEPCPFFGNSSYGDVSDMLTRFCCLVVGLCISLLIFRYFKTLRIFALLGASTLTIYLFHTFIVERISYKIIHGGSIPADIFTLTAISVLVTGALFLFSKVPLSKWIINPFSRLHAYIRSRRK